MPLTQHGERMMARLRGEYGAAKGERVFYASRNAGKPGFSDVENDAVKRRLAKNGRGARG